MAVQTLKKNIMLVAGTLLTSFFTFGFFSTLLSRDEPKEDLIIAVVFLVPSVALLVSGIRTGRLNGAARRYESIFAGDRNGVVTISELEKQTGSDRAKVLAELEALFRRGYFSGCTLQRGGDPCVIISDAMREEAGLGFVTVRCPLCGGANRLRAGSRGTCSFCGGAITDERA